MADGRCRCQRLLSQVRRLRRLACARVLAAHLFGRGFSSRSQSARLRLSCAMTAPAPWLGARIVSGSAAREFVHHVGDVFAPDGCVIAVIAALASILCVLRFATARLRAPCVILRRVLLRSRCHAALLHTLSRAHFTKSAWLCRACLSFRVHFTMNPCIWQTFVRMQM